MNKTFDRYASLAFLAIGAVFVAGSFSISSSAYGSSVGPNIFPLGLGSLLILLSIRLFIEALRYPDAEKKKESLDYKRFAIILVATILYGLTLELIGYVLGTFLFLVIGFQTMQRGGLGKSILISGIFSVGMYYVFVKLLDGTLPGFPSWMGF